MYVLKNSSMRYRNLYVLPNYLVLFFIKLKFSNLYCVQGIKVSLNFTNVQFPSQSYFLHDLLLCEYIYIQGVQ